MKAIAFLFLFSFVNTLAQQITVLDSITNDPIPFVHVFDGYSGVVANQDGRFYMDVSEKGDSLSLSCLGYASKTISFSQMNDTIYLAPKAVELLPVVLNSRSLTGAEVIDSILANTEKNYDFGLFSSEVFVYKSNSFDIDKLDVEIEKSTIDELDQTFVDDILNQLPKKERYRSYTKSKLLGDNNSNSYKLEVLKAGKLIDSMMIDTYDSIEETIDKILEKKVKKDSYFKVKSGPLLSVKVDNNTSRTVVDTTAQKEKLTPVDFAKDELSYLQTIHQITFDEEGKWLLPFLTKTTKYTFTNTGIVYDFIAPAYKVTFTSKGKKRYNGYLLVDVFDFGVYEIVYRSNLHENRIKLFGLFFEKRLNNKKYVFIKNQLNKYRLYHITSEDQMMFGIKRPIKIIEKNKVVRGRNRQNLLSMDVHYRLKSIDCRHTYYNSITPISAQSLEAFEPEHHILPKDFYSLNAIGQYIPDFPLN